MTKNLSKISIYYFMTIIQNKQTSDKNRENKVKFGYILISIFFVKSKNTKRIFFPEFFNV